MVEHQKRILGPFIRKMREKAGLSQKALGLLFNPTVTTQFISNVERGVTPLPLNHLPTLCEVLKISETELKLVMEQEYALKLSEKMGADPSSTSHPISDFEGPYMNAISIAYRLASPEVQKAFESACLNLLKVSKPIPPKKDDPISGSPHF